MTRLRRTSTLQKVISTHASIYNHFNHERHLNRREKFKNDRATALAEWRQLAA
jgi:putative transposase